MKRLRRLDFYDRPAEQALTWPRIVAIATVLILIGLGVQQLMQIQGSGADRLIDNAGGITASSVHPHRDARLRASSATIDYSSSRP